MAVHTYSSQPSGRPPQGVAPRRLTAVGAVEAIVLPAERNRLAVGCNEAAVGDGDPMGVTGQITQHLLGPCERRLAIGHPFGAPQPACRRRENTAPARVPLRGRPAIGVTPPPGTSDNAGCRRSCTRSPYGRTPRSRSVRRAPRAPPCDSARLHSSPSIARGSHAPDWPHAKQGRDRGKYPRPPELVEPWPAALRR